MKRNIPRTAALIGFALLVVSGVLFLVLQVTMGVEQPHASGAKIWEKVVGLMFVLTSAGGILSLLVSLITMVFTRVSRHFGVSVKS